MGLLIHDNRIFCSKYHRERLSGKPFIDLHDGIQEALCGALADPLLKYNRKSHEWFIIDKSKTIYHLLFEAGQIEYKFRVDNKLDISAITESI